MRVDLLTREYPPEVYGGAGVHVAELVKALRVDVDVLVRCFGLPRDEQGVYAYLVPPQLTNANPALATLGVDLQMAQDSGGADLVHSHTWYANGAGQLAQLLHGIPHVITAHSLEPLRPWKAEQLGGGYRVSSWIESGAFAAADAIIAVSHGMRRDILRSYPFLDEQKVSVVHNGIDLTTWVPTENPELLATLGIDPTRPSVVFVGRITRQKGLPYLLRAAAQLPKDVQLVLCAGAPDTPEILAEVREGVAELQKERTGVVWIEELLSQPDLSAVLTAATTFVCPSIYEPLGIVNLEAMACGAPVVGTATGGIPEVIDEGVTGRLVPIEQAEDGTGTPLNPQKFVDDLARILTEVVSDPETARAMGAAGRERAERDFGWAAIAKRTQEVYASVLS
ncbi:glycogen synthase [Lacisediminihabitans changchengi]|uniref:D-inositol 3-phosphate glycosyltransferase n=1 Tax=Lacisediminihabitans changchengi TaxID=2787634 RepID=A0A934W1H6_9MICO|nr:glycogen synthase [Lacisediminihabitans changchengi]MBK4346878.1 glycogen synthase [Lacisediminihabitans changchengi]MBK4347999.1 glycogen synthase [Lacisediminihabitans changchengi]